MGDKLVNTEQPGNRHETSEGPESEPLEEVDHLLGEVLDNSTREREGNNHDGKEDGAVPVSGDSGPKEM